MGSDPRSLKSVELVNWTGQAFIGRREHLSQARQRDELCEPGVYFLLSDGSEDNGAIDIYIGETDNFSERLSSHAQGKDFWTQFVVFVSKDKNLTKAHVKYLEREIYRLAEKAIGTLTVQNSTIPSGSSLPESDIAAMNEFMDNIIFVLETLGLGYFPSRDVSHPIPQLKNPEVVESGSADGVDFYITLPRDLVPEGHAQPRAFMYVKGNAYFLKAGSYIKSIPRQSFDEGHAYFNIWDQVIKSDAVVPTEFKGLLKTTRDIEFRSPSGAGTVARGGQTNGRTDWKRVTDDLSLKEVEAEGLEK